MTTPAFRRTAAAASAAAAALVVVGGVVRVTESGLGCPDWPLCEGRVVPAAAKEPILEYSHRAVAGLSVVLVALLAAWAWRRYRTRREVLVPAALALALVPLQAALGAVVVWQELPGWMVGIHFVAGMAYLGLVLTAATAARRGGRRPAAAAFGRLALAAAWAGAGLVVLGAAVVSLDAGHACGTGWPDCNGGFASGSAEAAVQVAHRTLAYAVAVLAVLLAVLARRGLGPRLAGTAPLAAAALQTGIGIALVSVEPGRAHDVLAALHVAGAAAVWSALVVLAASVGLPAEAKTRPRVPAAGRA